MSREMAEHLFVDKRDAIVKDDTEESVGTSPEAEQGFSFITEAENASTTQETPTPRRKGGRKPIYATTEERKQRNRQAQAAFRERRTEYIKQLEESIRAHESTLHTLQAAQRSAFDECLMLRYKNSLLERILLEKGIDVQAELRAKTDSPNLGPNHMPSQMVPPPPIPQRSIANRHKHRRSLSSLAPKLDPISTPSVLPPLHTKTRPTRPPHIISPTGSGPLPLSPTASDASYRSLESISRTKAMPGSNRRSVQIVLQSDNDELIPGQGMQYYQKSAFQNHLQQQRQQMDDYDDPAEMMDETDIEPRSEPGAYSSQYEAMDLSAVSPATQAPQISRTHSTQHGYPSMAGLVDDNFDPFGLTASMTFPGTFSFDQGSQGHI